MKKKAKKIKKDSLLEAIANSKGVVIALLVGSILYLNLNFRIINLPSWFEYLRFFLVLFLFILFFYSRYKKYVEYYQKIIKDKVYISFFIIATLIFSYVGQSFLNIPFLYYLKIKSTNSLIFKDYANITSFSELKYDTIVYTYNNRDYWIYYNLKSFDTNEIIKNKKVELYLRETLFGAYYVEEIRIVDKKM